MRALSTLIRLAGGAVLRLVKTALLVALLAGIPYGLLTQIGSPLPRHLPTSDQISRTLTGPVSDTLVLNVLAAALWILWAAFLVSFAVEVVAAARGVPRPRLGPIAPLQTLAGWLIAGITAGVLAAAPVMAVAGHAAPAAAVVVTTPAQTTPASYSAINGAHRPPPAATITLPLSTVDDRSPLLAAATTTSARAPATQMPVYEVRHDDWLGVIAQRYLGDFDRYHDIQRLNPDLITDPNHIEPQWRLILPADAYDHGARIHATGHLVVKPPAATNPAPGNPTQPGPPTTQPSQGGSGGSASPAPSATPSPSVSSSPTTSPAPSRTATGSAGAGGPAASASSGHSDPAPHSDPPAQQQPAHRHGVSLPGGWISLPAAAALVAAAAMVWLRRRHRYVPTPLSTRTSDDQDLRPLPPVVNRVRRAVREQAPELLQPAAPATPTVADYHAADAAHRPDLPPVGPSGLDLAGLGDRVPAGGLGLVGPGAEPAARGLLVATLSSGSPADPDAKGQVIIPADGLTTLLGADAVQVGDIPRLQVTANLSEALTRAEELLIERRRLLEDHDAADLAGMRAADPYHPPMPPVLLLADTPPAELRARLTTALHLGGPLQISAVLLGDWPRGDTLTVRADGHTGDAGHGRLGVLDVPTTLQLLAVLREAHTGQPTPATVDTPPGADLSTPAPTVDAAAEAAAEPVGDDTEPAHADASTDPSATASAPTDEPAAPAVDQPEPEPDTAVPTPAPGKPARRRPVRIQLLGEPVILDGDGSPVNGLRHHARELLVYLAVHRSGADLSQIMEAFWPTATVRRAGERLSTEAGNLRGRIRHAAGVTSEDKGFQPVVNPGSRYHLNPDLVDIDVWRLIDLLRRAGAATDPTAKAALLRRAIDAHTGPLADGHDYDWITQPREQLRRHGIRARLDLATLLGDAEPATAADLLRAATQLNPINEDLARQAMRALARIGDAAAARTVLQQLRAALDDIDEEPSAETIALAAQLQRDLASTASDEQTRSTAGNDSH